MTNPFPERVEPVDIFNDIDNTTELQQIIDAGHKPAPRMTAQQQAREQHRKNAQTFADNFTEETE